MRHGRFLVVGALLAASCAMEQYEGDEENLSDAYEEMLDADGSADSARCSGVVVPDRGPFDNRIALTFDDGPSLANTPRVLEVLAAHHALATFFINGRTVGSAEADMLRQMAAQGHLIGNHTQSHKDSRQLSADAFRRELEQTDQVIRGLGIPPTFMRFPYGSASCTTADIAREAGYRITGWHIDTADWCFSNPRGGVGYCHPDTFAYVPDRYRSDFVGWIVYQAQQNGGGVMLMHDIQSYTASQLDAVLTALEQAGFSFVRLDDVSTFPLLNGTTPPQSWIGTPCSDQSVCAFGAGADRLGSCTSSDPEVPGFCTMTCEGYCPDRHGFATTFCIESATPGVGMCAAWSDELNGFCALIPGTTAQVRPRFIGSSGASASEAMVCVN